MTAGVAPEAPHAEPVSARTATSGTLNGVVSPGKEGETGTYRFVHAEGSSCKGGAETAPQEVSGALAAPASAAVTGLEAGHTYTYCLKAINALGQASALSNEISFTAAVLPETPAGEQAEVTGSSTANVKGIINPANGGEAGTYRFAYSPSATSCTESGLLAPEGGEPGVAYGTKSAEEAHIELKNLLPGTVYSFCLQATNEAGELVEGVPVRFKTLPAPPMVSAPTLVSVGSGAAEVSAEVDPGGEPTGYQVEYVTAAAFAARGFAEPSFAPATATEIPALNQSTTVHVTLTGLSAETEYHYRFTAHNETGKEVTGHEATFTTAATEGGGLPDNRAYELVSSPGSGEPYYPPVPGGWQSESFDGFYGDQTFQAAANGERVAYVGEPGESGGVGQSEILNQEMAERTSGGWKAQDITPTIPAQGAIASEPLFQAFSPQLTSAVFEEPLNVPPLAGGVAAGCRALDVRAGLPGSGSLTPLFTNGVTPGNCGTPLFAGESTDQKHVIFQTEAALTPGSLEATEVPVEHDEEHHANVSIGKGCAFICNLYEAGEGKLTLVNQIERDGVMTPVPNATFGGYGGPSEKSQGRSGLPDFSHAISSDGSRVFWTDTEPETEEGQAVPKGAPLEEVYVLQDGAKELKVSGPGSQFWTATPDGHYAYYVEDEGFSAQNGRYGRLYRFDSETGESVPLTTAGAGVMSVVGTNTSGPDGEYVYLVAEGGGPVFGAGVQGEPNYYVIHDGVTSLVATGGEFDHFIDTDRAGTLTNTAPWDPNLGFRQVAVSSDGKHLVFETQRQLTAFNNDEAVEVYVYSAAEAKLVCASCDAAGVPPGGEEARAGKLTVSAESFTYTHRWMSANGNRVFFTTSQGLVPQDVNGVEDVYEWEREGEGSCPVKSPASPVGGCQYLLSGGASPYASYFVDADEAGDNAFFVHVGALGDVQVPAGHLELYDARIGGGFPAVCGGDGCASGEVSAAPSVPGSVSGPPSAGFAGTGNFPPVSPAKPRVLTRAQLLAKALAVCRREHRRGHARTACERSAQSRYGPVKKARARKASRDGRGNQ
jgi:hypothetical protein